MSNLTHGTPLQTYGAGGRHVVLPVKASAQIYEGAMVAQINGACVTATTAAAGRVVGVATHDALGGASDGAVRIELLTDKIFLFKAGTNAPTDATPFGTLLYAEDDNSVGTGGIGGTGEGAVGLFMGIEDDGRVRVFIGVLAADVLPLNGAALADTATQTVQPLGRLTRFNMATMSQGCTVTLGTTGAVVGDIIRIVRTSTAAQTLTVVDGGTGTPTLVVLVASKKGFAQAYFDGTNWQLDGCSAN